MAKKPIAHPDRSHQYKRTKLKQSVVFRCVLPGCSHYLTRPFIIGRIASCGNCKREFVIDAFAIRNVNLVCTNCRNARVKIKTQDPDEVEALLNELGIELPEELF
jgi:hypothetical protein